MVRAAVVNDIPVLMSLLQEVNLVHHLGRPDLFRKGTKYGEEDLIQILSDPETPVFVYEAPDGSVLGHAFCKFENVSGDRLLCDRLTLYVDDICVSSSAQRQGVGKALYLHVRDFAKTHGCYNLTLNVWSCNPGALAFYETMGLKPYKIGMEEILSEKQES